MMRMKPLVNCLGVKPEILLALMVACEVYNEFGIDMTVTSLTDSKHGAHSHHYKGLAVDLGVVGMNADQVEDCRKEIQRRVCSQYQVINEKNHIHIEYDPA